MAWFGTNPNDAVTSVVRLCIKLDGRQKIWRHAILAANLKECLNLP